MLRRAAITVRTRIRPRVVLSLAIPLALLAAGAAAPLALRVEAVRGDGANNNATLGIATAPAVRVLDGNGQPVEGALVIFSPPEKGVSVTFAGYDSVATAITDDSGVAVAPPLRPKGGNGPLEIRVTASYGSELANCAIRQINLGVGGDAERERELDVVRLPEEVPASGQGPRGVEFLVRLDDGMGRPAASASVVFTLRRVRSGGKTEELSRVATASGEDGKALALMPKRSGARLELVVQAEWNGRRATRYFPLNRSAALQ
jgi:hypothetical protein